MYDEQDIQEVLMRLDPQQLTNLGIIPEQQEGLERQLAQAAALRKVPQPEGGMVGRVYVPPSIMQNAAATISNIRGANQQGTLQKQMADLLRQKAAGRLDALKARANIPKPIVGSAGAADLGGGSDPLAFLFGAGAGNGLG